VDSKANVTVEMLVPHQADLAAIEKPISIGLCTLFSSKCTGNLTDALFYKDEFQLSRGGTCGRAIEFRVTSMTDILKNSDFSSKNQ
jgi:hypothetical protein